MDLIKVVFDIPVRKSFDYLPGKFAGGIEVGTRVLAPFGKRIMLGWIIGFENQSDTQEQYKKLIKVYEKQSLLTPELLSIAKQISDFYFSSFGQSLAAITRQLSLIEVNTPLVQTCSGRIHPTTRAINRTATKIAEKKKPLCIQNQNDNETKSQLHDLTQLRGYQRCFIHFKRTAAKSKTYLEIAENCLNGSALLLFPEISEAEMFYKENRRILGERLILFHGQLSKTEKTLLWKRMLIEKHLIVAGTRIAVFSPLSDLSLILIDDSCSISYREQQKPKYCTVQVAKWRAEINNAPVISGESSVSVEDYYYMKQFCQLPDTKSVDSERQEGDCRVAKNTPRNDKQSEDFKVKEKHCRVFEIPENPCATNEKKNEFQPDSPDIYLFELQRRNIDTKIPFLLKETRALLEESLLKENKIAILHNRKSSAVLACKECNYRFVCKNCNAVMIPLGKEDIMSCRLCGLNKPMPKKCPKCGSKKLGERSFGLARIAKTLKENYPDTTVSVKTAKSNSSCSNSQIFVGTQVIKKVLLKVDIHLIIVINGERFFDFPDFRAEEKFFHLLSEIAASMPCIGSKIIIQTHNPSLPLYKALKDRQPGIFYNRELSIRKQLDYPPFATIIKIVLKGKTQKHIQEKGEAIESFLSGEHVSVFHSELSPPSGRQTNYIWKWILKLKIQSDRDKLNTLLNLFPVSVEVDPLKI